MNPSAAAASRLPSPVEIHTSVDRPLLIEGEADKRLIIKVEVEGTRVESANDLTPLNLAIVLERSG